MSVMGTPVGRVEDPVFLTEGGTYLAEVAAASALADALTAEQVRQAIATASVGQAGPGAPGAEADA